MNRKPGQLTRGQVQAYALLAAIQTVITAGLIAIELIGSVGGASIVLLAMPLWSTYIVVRRGRAALNWLPEQRNLLLLMALILTCAVLAYAFIAAIDASAPTLAWVLVTVLIAMTIYSWARFLQALLGNRQRQGSM